MMRPYRPFFFIAVLILLWAFALWYDWRTFVAVTALGVVIDLIFRIARWAMKRRQRSS